MPEARLIDLLTRLKGKQVTVHISDGLKVAGVLDDVQADYIVVEEKFIVPIARIGYIAKALASF